MKIKIDKRKIKKYIRKIYFGSGFPIGRIGLYYYLASNKIFTYCKNIKTIISITSYENMVNYCKNKY